AECQDGDVGNLAHCGGLSGDGMCCVEVLAGLCPSSPPEFALPDPRRGAHYTVLLRVVNVRSGTRQRTPRCAWRGPERVIWPHVRVRAHPYPRSVALGHAAAGRGPVGG